MDAIRFTPEELGVSLRRASAVDVHFKQIFISIAFDLERPKWEVVKKLYWDKVIRESRTLEKARETLGCGSTTMYKYASARDDKCD